MNRSLPALVLAFSLALAASVAWARGASAAVQANRIDVVRPDAPELAAFGPHDIGVRTLVVTDRDRPDILNARAGEPVPTYDRSLTVEVWYPAALAPGQVPGTSYTTTTRNPDIVATLTGRAVRDAAPSADGPYPLVIVSHGYPGNRFLLSHLGENLASKGYVVASIDHKDSTYEDQQNFGSTLYNRAPDQLAVLNAMAGFAGQAGHFLRGVVDADRTAIIGYSMGGYGALNNLGAGYSEASVASGSAPPNRLLYDLAAANPEYRRRLDPRIKAGIPIGPWGMQGGFWDAAGLAGMTVPALFVAGDADGTAGYENGVRAIYEGAINSDRYLLVFKNAGHNAAAPIPLPVEFLEAGNPQGASHYVDAVWDNVRMNNILQHFATAFLDLHLKGVAEMRSYLDVPEDGAAGQGGWKGFSGRSAVGLRMYRNPSLASTGGAKLLVAHRGASGYAPEHTLEAYRLAMAQGADFIEPDLQITKDGVLVAMHDLTLDRTTNVREVFPDRFREETSGDRTVRRWYVSDFTLAEVKTLDAGSWFSEEFQGARVPTLAEVIELALGRVGIFPETKAPDLYNTDGYQMERLLLAELARYGLDRPGGVPGTPVIIQSFSAESLRILRQDLGTELPLTFLLSGGQAEEWLSPEGLQRMREFASGIGPTKGLLLADPEAVGRAHALGLTVIPYTFSTNPGTFPTPTAEMDHFLHVLGVDGLFTNNPDLFPRLPVAAGG